MNFADLVGNRDPQLHAVHLSQKPLQPFVHRVERQVCALSPSERTEHVRLREKPDGKGAQRVLGVGQTGN